MAAMAQDLLTVAVATAKFNPQVAMVVGRLKEAIMRGLPSEATSTKENILTALLHLDVALTAATIKGTHTLLRGKHMDVNLMDMEADSPATSRLEILAATEVDSLVTDSSEKSITTQAESLAMASSEILVATQAESLATVSSETLLATRVNIPAKIKLESSLATDSLERSAATVVDSLATRSREVTVGRLTKTTEKAEGTILMINTGKAVQSSITTAAMEFLRNKSRS